MALALTRRLGESITIQAPGRAPIVVTPTSLHLLKIQAPPDAEFRSPQGRFHAVVILLPGVDPIKVTLVPIERRASKVKLVIDAPAWIDVNRPERRAVRPATQPDAPVAPAYAE
jgi:sRNA-binding carbon storage regulator CsrA